MDLDTKKNLICKNLQEVIGIEDLEKILKERDLNIYWGTAPTGNPHLGYFVPIYKIADFLKAGSNVTILFADIHAYLDNMKSSLEELENKTKYYEFIIKEMLKLINVPIDKLKFVKGSDFQLSKEYSLDLYKLSALITTKGAQHAGADVVKQTENPKLSGLLYPLLQALDEEYLKVDAQFGGIDQRKIFMLSRDYISKIGYKKRIHLMNPLIPGLGESGKMSSSEINSKIDFFDTEKQIRKKINKAYSIDGQVENNGLLAILKYILLPKLNSENRKFIINRPEEYGGKISFENYEEIEKEFAFSKLSSIDLKQGVADELILFFEPIRLKIIENKELLFKAYPDLKKTIQL